MFAAGLALALLHLGFFAAPGPAKAAATRLPDELVTYKPANPEGTRKLHVFYPPGGHTNAPAIVFFGGGAWKTQSPTQFFAHATHLSAQGIVCIPAEYRTRNTGGVSPFGCVEDGNSALRYVRQHAAELGVDSNRIAAAGGSAGGHVAACTAQFPEVRDAGEDPAISSSPNLLLLFNPVLDTSPLGFGSGSFDPGEDPLDLSPRHHLGPGLAPAIAFHGTADQTVPFQNELDYRQATRQAGNFYTLFAFPGRDHGFFNDTSSKSTQNDGDYYQTIAYLEDFLVKHRFLSTWPTATTFGSVAVYGQAPVTSNAVDASVGGKSVQSFAADVQSACLAGRGGVVNFEAGFAAAPSSGGTSNNPLGHNFDFLFGSNKVMRVTSSLDFYLYTNDNNSQVNTISGSNNLLSVTFSTVPSANFTWIFRGVRNGAPREAVAELGFTVLSRTTYPSTGAVIAATARFSGGGATTLSAVVGNGRGTGDTFFHFAAPTNEWIQSVDFTNRMVQTNATTANSARLALEDVAFITAVPPELRIDAASLSGPQSELRFWSGNGRSYRLERAADPASWTLAQPNLSGTGGTATAVDTNALDFLATRGRVLYRVVEE